MAKDICKPNIRELRFKIQKPLRPIWTLQTSPLPESKPSFPDYHPIVLCSASRRVNGAESSEGGYIQGAADDHEAWARGLTPTIFWKNKDKLLNTNEENLPSLITALINQERGPDALPILINPTTNLYISTTQNLDIAPFDAIISCTPEPLTTTHQEHVKSKKYLHLRCQTGKLGSRDLRAQLAYLPAFFSSLPSSPEKILVCCPTGKDLSVGAALAVLCLYADESGKISTERREGKIDKTFIKQRLAWLTTNPTLNPPRGTLQSVNAFLMPDPSAASKEGMEPTQIPPEQLVLSTPSDAAVATDTTTPFATPLKTSNTPPSNSNPPNIPATLFTSLHNSSKPWAFTRQLSSVLPTHPSGTVTGTATFTPYTAPASEPPNPNTLLYAEEGEFLTSSGLHFVARRKYVYQLKPGLETGEEPYIAVHFYEDENGREGFGGLFVEMGELERDDESDDGVLRAGNREQHLCAEDLYTASWRFSGGMGGDDGEEREKWWEVRYDVKGPKKDYVSTTRYTPV